MNDDIFREVVVDHGRFLIEEPYSVEIRREVAALDRGALTMIDVEHEADGYCCQIEPWGTTLARLLDGEAR